MKGFTLVEVLLCMALLTGLFVGGMNVYIYCFNMHETSRNSIIALNEARSQIESIKNLLADLNNPEYSNNFLSIVPNYNGQTAALTSMDGIMRTEASYVDEAHIGKKLILLRVVVAWRQKGGRIIGEAKDAPPPGAVLGLVFSDLDGDGKIESPVELVTAVNSKK